MAKAIYWSELSDPPPGWTESPAWMPAWDLGEDTIFVETMSGDSGFVEVELSASRGVTWWKGLAIVRSRNDRRPLASIETQDDRNRTFPIRMRSGEVGDETLLVLSKAKFLGVHTEMYEIPLRELNRGDIDGKLFRLHWDRDS